jgi:hypothetical protein
LTFVAITSAFVGCVTVTGKETAAQSTPTLHRVPDSHLLSSPTATWVFYRVRRITYRATIVLAYTYLFKFILLFYIIIPVYFLYTFILYFLTSYDYNGNMYLRYFDGNVIF